MASRNLCLERRVRWEIRLCWFFLFWLQHFPWEILRTQTASWLKFLIPRLGLIGYSVGWRRKSDRRCVYGCSSRPMNTKRVGKEEKREKKNSFLARPRWMAVTVSRGRTKAAANPPNGGCRFPSGPLLCWIWPGGSRRRWRPIPSRTSDWVEADIIGGPLFQSYGLEIDTPLHHRHQK